VFTIDCGVAATSFDVLSSSEWFWGCREASKSGLSSFGVGHVIVSVMDTESERTPWAQGTVLMGPSQW